MQRRRQKQSRRRRHLEFFDRMVLVRAVVANLRRRGCGGVIHLGCDANTYVEGRPVSTLAPQNRNTISKILVVVGSYLTNLAYKNSKIWIVLVYLIEYTKQLLPINVLGFWC